MRRYLWWVVFLILLLGSPTAFAQADFADVVTFGDSLTHNDLLGWFYGNPQDMYGEDPMEAVFTKGSAAGDELSNYAVAGSESGDVGLQVDLYDFLRLINAQDKATLIGFEIGGNDILNNIDLLSLYAPGENADADAVIDSLLKNIRDDLVRLRTGHREAQFVIWTIPDVTLTPSLWFALSPDEVAHVQAHIERANRRIRGLNRYAFVIVVDVFDLIRKTVENPPVLFGYSLVPPPDYGDYDHIFADEIHPTAVSNALIANAIIDAMNKKWGDAIPFYSDAELADLAHIPH